MPLGPEPGHPSSDTSAIACALRPLSKDLARRTDDCYAKSPVHSPTILAFRAGTHPSKHASGVEAARMRKKNKKSLLRKIVLRLPDLNHAKNTVLSSLSSPNFEAELQVRN